MTSGQADRETRDGWFLPQSAELGPLKMGETLWYYDGPVLFTVLGQGMTYLAQEIESEDAAGRYLYVAVSEERLADVLADRVSLRDAFQQAESGTGYIVSVPRDPDAATTAQAVPLASLSGNYFADEGLYLGCDRAAADDLSSGVPGSREDQEDK